MTEKKYKAKQIAISNADGSVDVIDILTKDILDNISKLENTISSGSVSNADTVDNKDAEDFFNIDKTATNFNDAIEEGKYEISNGGNSISNAPSTSYKYYICLVYKLNALICQIAIAVANTPQTYIRYSLDRGSTWSTNSYNNGWYRLWNQANDGIGTNLDADLLDGKHAASFFDITLSSSSFANATTQGKYTIINNPSDSPTPKDTLTIGWICLVFYNDVLINDKKSITQIAINNMNKQQMYIRNQKNGTWGSWEVIATTHSLATMQFDDTYYTKYNSISDIANEIANGTVNNSNKLNGLLANQLFNSSKTATDFNNATETGLYYITGINSEHPDNAPSTDYTQWGCLVFREPNKLGITQIAFGYANAGAYTYTPNLYIRRGTNTNFTYSTWNKLWTGSFGSGSTLDADKLDGYHASRFAWCDDTFVTSINDIPETPGIYLLSTNTITNSSDHYGIFKSTWGIASKGNSSLIAISMTTGIIYTGIYNADGTVVTWNEVKSSTTVSPTIPVVTEDPTNPTDGQMWIRSDLL